MWTCSHLPTMAEDALSFADAVVVVVGPASVVPFGVGSPEHAAKRLIRATRYQTLRRNPNLANAAPSLASPSLWHSSSSLERPFQAKVGPRGMSSSSRSMTFVRSRFAARAFSLTWRPSRLPAIADVTPGWCSTHAIAT
ncbi:MAG: hypothetical protein QOH90_1563 [Actinomycetota bacterium]|nr:hypothetical protein [Actinomycetota bacterium]